MDNINNLQGWSVVKLDLPALIECLNQSYKSFDIEGVFHYACAISSYVECMEVLKNVKN